MSINHFSAETRLYWNDQQPATWLTNSASPRFNLNDIHEDEEDDDVVVSDSNNNNNAEAEAEAEAEATEEEEKEAMFEKPLTPSDVGKLNRLVIPKQHAEKHFPLDSVSGDSAKGLLLSFEDESGKCWRFRYSYWNSSQSYVLTKGWSRYVKDKRLHAGDVVLFHRHRLQPQRFFITCTRRQQQLNPTSTTSTTAATITTANSNRSSSFYSAQAYPAHHLPSFPYQQRQQHSLHAPPGGGSQEGQNETTGCGNSSSSSGRVLRLFGVNMECQADNDSQTSTPQCSYTMSSNQPTLTHHLNHHPHQTSYSSSSNPHHHMLHQQPY